MLIALDYDETYTVDPEFWDMVISATARAFGMTRQEVQRWRASGFIPFKLGERAEELTGGKVKAADVWKAAATARHH